MANAGSDAAIQSLVDRYKVCWDSFPEWSRTNDERKQSGVIVELYGTHDTPGVVPTAGCRHCIPVIQALLTIADDVAERARDRLVSIRAHSGIEYAVERGARPDIVVALAFAPFGAASPSATGLPEEVRARLRELGIAERRWRTGGD